MDILEELRQGRGFTENDKDIAEYLLEHASEIPDTPISDLARELRRSKSSIVRLCHKLGLDGYRDLRIQVARELERMRTAPRSVDPDRPFIEDSSTADIAASIAALSKQAVDATHATLRIADVRKAARLILGARHVVYYAIGDSCAAMSAFIQQLYKIGIACATGLPMGDRGVLGRTLDGRDLAIIVSHSGNLVDNYRSTIDMLRARGCRTILITGNASLAERMMGTDCIFLLPEGENRGERLATFFSQTCTEYVLNCIFAEAYAKDYESNLANWHDEMRDYSESSDE